MHYPSSGLYPSFVGLLQQVFEDYLMGCTSIDEVYVFTILNIRF